MCVGFQRTLQVYILIKRTVNFVPPATYPRGRNVAGYPGPENVFLDLCLGMYMFCYEGTPKLFIFRRKE